MWSSSSLDQIQTCRHNFSLEVLRTKLLYPMQFPVGNVKVDKNTQEEKCVFFNHGTKFCWEFFSPIHMTLWNQSFWELEDMKQENLKKKKIRVLEERFGNSPGCADGSQRWWNSIESDDVVVVANMRHHHNRLLEAARLLANNTTCGFNWQQEETHSYFSSIAPFGHPASKMSPI